MEMALFGGKGVCRQATPNSSAPTHSSIVKSRELIREIQTELITGLVVFSHCSAHSERKKERCATLQDGTGVRSTLEALFPTES